MPAENKHIISRLIRIEGLVQGIGFRPFIYRLAKDNHIAGWVENTNECVMIRAEGPSENVLNFIQSITKQAPPASQIDSIHHEIVEVENLKNFLIEKSKSYSDQITLVSPDIAVCNHCLDDMKHQPLRAGYPLINCTHCGPRFSIIRDLPYDRKNTSMSEFKMCPSCRNEYEDISDRRFHAQPVACNQCGPQYTMYVNDKKIQSIDAITETAASLIDCGKILAIKGTGGFQLVCDAQNEESVNHLRSRKIRYGKPFAVMFRDLATVNKYVFINEVETAELTSWKRTIVLLKKKKNIVHNISMGFDTTGVILPYMPFHYLLFEKIKSDAIIFTSGNFSEEPIIIDNETALKKLTFIADAIITYNRDIHNRVDDSVLFVGKNKIRMIRRSRGYVPAPVRLNIDVEGILAVGAELTNCFAIGKGRHALMSQHIGDLKNMETYDFFSESINRFKKLFRFKPTLIVSDMHPDYLSTRYALESKIPLIQVQHHHAHIAACMAEYGLDEKIIGVAFDGTGYGSDGQIWGGEFLICDLEQYERYTHFETMPLPGGDKVVYEPWRMAFSYLYSYFGKEIFNESFDFLQEIDPREINLLITAIEKKINTPCTSSVGRLFDAVSAMINLCSFTSFHAEAPMRLESIADRDCKGSYSFEVNQTISLKKMFYEIITDMRQPVSPYEIAGKFHNTIINIIFTVASRIRKQSGINKVLLAGGSFQNKIILERTIELLEYNSFNVFTNSKVPMNDGGIALGQLLIAAKRRFKNN